MGGGGGGAMHHFVLSAFSECLFSCLQVRVLFHNQIIYSLFCLPAYSDWWQPEIVTTDLNNVTDEYATFLHELHGVLADNPTCKNVNDVPVLAR